ncbi:MAG: hypothetical protein WA156_12020 [Methylocystis silviterrae]
MGKSSSASNDPFSGYAALMQAQAAQQQMNLGGDWLTFAKEQFAVGNERQTGIDRQGDGSTACRYGASVWLASRLR